MAKLTACRYCGEATQPTARKRPHCGEWFSPRDRRRAAAQTTSRGVRALVIWFIVLPACGVVALLLALWITGGLG